MNLKKVTAGGHTLPMSYEILKDSRMSVTAKHKIYPYLPLTGSSAVVLLCLPLCEARQDAGLEPPAT